MTETGVSRVDYTLAQLVVGVNQLIEQVVITHMRLLPPHPEVYTLQSDVRRHWCAIHHAQVYRHRQQQVVERHHPLGAVRACRRSILSSRTMSSSRSSSSRSSSSRRLLARVSRLRKALVRVSTLVLRARLPSPPVRLSSAIPRIRFAQVSCASVHKLIIANRFSLSASVSRHPPPRGLLGRHRHRHQHRLIHARPSVVPARRPS
jgi:hypothetical protein